MSLLRACLLFLGLLLQATPVFAQDKPFAHAGIAKDAERYESFLKSTWKPDGRPARDHVAEGAALRAAGGDARAASRSFAVAVVTDPKSIPGWLGLARSLLAIKADPQKNSERYDLPIYSTGAAWLAYQRATTKADEAMALFVMAEGMARRSYWRPAIDALSHSLKLADTAEVRAAYDKMRASHGFRIVDHKVDFNAAQPRLCVQFSEALALGAIDYAKFVTVDGRDPQSVAAEGRQLCIEGLQHGKRYEARIKTGVPSTVGETLLKDAEIATYIRDRSPTVRVSGRNYVLPSRGQQGIPLVTVNTKSVSIEVYRIGDRGLSGAVQGENFQKQLDSMDLEALRERTGARVYKGELEIANRLNEDVTTAFPVNEAITQLEPGVYVLTAATATTRQREDDESSASMMATQWFIVSDLGLTAFSGADGIHAFVRSLATTVAAAGVDVKLVARNNEVLGTAKTDARGYARFPSGLKRGEGGLAPALLVAELNGQDYAFLDLATAAFDLTDRGVKGRDAPGPIDGYLYSDRGVYRPGEDVHLTGLLRDAESKALAMPATLVLHRPDGVEHSRTTLLDQGLGGRTATIRLSSSSMTGSWKAKLHTDPKTDPVAQVTFLVEDFVPERLDMTLEPVAKALIPDQAGRINVSGKYLYGPPAADLALEGEIVVKPATTPVAGLEGYRFGLADEQITPVRKPLEGLPNTDAEGKAALAITLPPIPETAQPLVAEVMIRLRESGGRTIERRTSLPVDTQQPRIGVKPLFQGAEIGEGDTATFDVILLDKAGQRVAGKELSWQLYRLNQSWQWYNRDGSWAYEAVTTTRRLAGGKVKGDGDAAARIAQAVDWGRYRLEVTTADASGPVTSVIFNSGWWGGEAADTPESLDVVLDKPSYNAGEIAKVKIASRHAGRALVTVVGSGLLSSKEAEIPAGGGEVPLEVAEAWMPGAYVAVMFYRALDEKTRRMPGRAVGVRWLGLDTSPRTLKVSMDPPAKVKPGSALSVPIKVAGLTQGEEARITVAAVDVGILNLTRFATPRPEAWFLGQRKLGLEIRDLYGRLIDGMRAERGKLRSGGDGDGGAASNGSPPVEATLALFSGIVRVGVDGTAKVEFPMPDFNGAVRLMAVAWSQTKTGSAEREVIVRDALALTATAPRFLTLGDEARLELDVHNVEGVAGRYRIAVATDADGARGTMPARDLELTAGDHKRERLMLKPTTVGRHVYDVSVTGPNGIDVKRTLTLDVKTPASDVRRVYTATLTPKGGRMSLSPDALADLIPSRTRINMSVGPTAGFDVPGLVTQLDRYPYGCAEQTVSRALPLLYLNAVAARIGVAGEAEAKLRIAKAIDRVFEMQDGQGAFGVWGPSSTDLWVTSYVTDFLTRAKELGHTVRPAAFNQALDRLLSYTSYAQDFDNGGEQRAYALYVLARNGRAPVGELRYDVDTRLDKFGTALAKAQLGAALAMMGDKPRSDRAFAAAMKGLAETDNGAPRGDYGSLLRDSAAVLTLAAETSAGKAEMPRLAGVIAKAFSSRTYTSTQEQAWMLLAAHALGQQGKAMRLTVNGAAHQGELMRAVDPSELSRALTVVNGGDEPVDAFVSVLGAALTPEPASSKGLTIERSYYTLDGKQVDLESAKGGRSTLQQNDRLVVVLKVSAEAEGGRILLVDRLPAGLEVENPRIVDSGDVKSLAWLKTTLAPEHIEFRDDKVVAAFNYFGESNSRRDGQKDGASESTIAFIVRAVSPGSFVHPAATVEDMYRPDRFARTDAGRLEITAKE